MAQLYRLVNEVDRYKAPTQRAVASRFDARRRSAASPARDLKLARLTKANVFVVGDDDAVARFITALSPSLATPIVVRPRGERLQLSPTFPPVGTIVVYDVDTLTPDEQHALYRWMAGNGATQIVSTASKFLQPMLQAGAFNERLYYRLNVLTIDLTSPVAH
jgi:hypothetical protein